MKKLAVLLGFASLLVSHSGHSNVILNGGFEGNRVNQNSWAWFQSQNVNGWQGSNIEVWNAFKGVSAVEGQQFAELNAHGPNQGAFSIWQNFNTSAGQDYELSFVYRARANSNEAFRVDLTSGNGTLFSQIFDDHTVSSWSNFSTTFNASGNDARLTFTSLNAGTVGNFLDNVRIESSPGEPLSTTVSEPTIPTMMAMGLGLFAVSRRKKARTESNLA